MSWRPSRVSSPDRYHRCHITCMIIFQRTMSSQHTSPVWAPLKVLTCLLVKACALAGDPKGPLARIPSLSEDLVKAINEGIWWVFHMHPSCGMSDFHLCTA